MKTKVSFIVSAILAVSCAIDEPWTGYEEDRLFMMQTTVDEPSQEVILSAGSTKSVGVLPSGDTLYVSSVSTGMADAMTKSAPVTELFPTFACSGYSFSGSWQGTETPDLFFNAQFTKNEYNIWNSADRYLWPGESVSCRFYAVAPYSDTNPKITSSASTAGAPSYAYTVPNDPAQQIDVLESVSDDMAGDSYNYVRLKFRHALAGIRVKTSDFGVSGTISSVVIEGLYNSGSRTVGASSWIGLTGNATYTVNPSAIVGEENDFNLVEGDNTLLVIPQTCPSGAKMTITFINKGDGSSHTLTCDLSGKQLSMGKITTYILSLDPNGWTADWIGVSQTADFVNTDADSDPQQISVKTYKQHITGIRKALRWSTEFSTDEGRTWTTTPPAWLSLSETSGPGIEDEQVINVVAAKRTYEQQLISVQNEASEDEARSKAMQSDTELGTYDEPADLSYYDYNGYRAVSMNTANCYVVHRPGWYRIPLVYGNAIKNGSVNVNSFFWPNISSTTDAESGAVTYYDTDFRDSYDVAFTASSSPYVKAHIEAAGKTLGEVSLLWFDSPCIIEVEAELRDKGTQCPYIVFHIPAEKACEGNALIAVKDSDGNVAWSWHVWICNRDLSPLSLTNYTSQVFEIMPVNLGWNGWGTQATFKIYRGRSCQVKFIAGTASKIITVNQPQVETLTGSTTVTNSSPYYQWGRKDPFKGLGDPGTSGTGFVYSSVAVSQAIAHQNPNMYYYNSRSTNWTTDQFNYFWDADNAVFSIDSPVVKTIYDPCPSGWNLPQLNTFTGFISTGANVSSASSIKAIGAFNQGWYFKRNAADATGSYFPAAGLRDTYQGRGAKLNLVGTSGYCWLSVPSSATNGRSLGFNSSYVNPQSSNNRSNGYSVRPCRSAE